MEKRTKKEIIAEIENVFRNNPSLEIDASEFGFVNKRYALVGHILCFMHDTVLVKMHKDSVVHWKADLSGMKKENLVRLLERLKG